jgi:tetratricopeptide (TPR) repeat protein
MKQFNDAMKMFEKQLSLARSLGDVMNEANAFTSLGNCQKYAGNYEKAILYYKQELMFRQTASDLQGEVNALGKNLMINFLFFI